MKKYIFENGVMKLNPEYKAAEEAGGKAVTQKPAALAVVSTMDDALEAGAVQAAATGEPMKMAPSTQASIEIMQDEGYVQKFEAGKAFEPGEVLDKLTEYFATYEVPLGMVNKLCMLSQFDINLMIDDSGSMRQDTNCTVAVAGEYMKRKLTGPTRYMTRWEEVEDRLHTIVDILTWVPTGPIRVAFFNSDAKLAFTRKGKAPEAFARDAHRQIEQAFEKLPYGATPTLKVLREAFAAASAPTAHYLFTDGVPSDACVQQFPSGEVRYPDLEQLVKRRRNPAEQPLTFVSCTDEAAESEWMKTLEEAAPYCSELDDYQDECREVLRDQGALFPYTRGTWLLCLLAAAMNPDDLDSIDEAYPFTKAQMDNMMGRVLTPREYTDYIRAHPQRHAVEPHLKELATSSEPGRRVCERLGIRVMTAPPAAQPSRKAGAPCVPVRPPPAPAGGRPGGFRPGQPAGYKWNRMCY